MKKTLPSIKSMQAFLATASHLNFTHAASELNLTQGAISRQIQSLEQHLGTELFYRHARGLSLTPKGEQLSPLIEESLNQLHSALEKVSGGESKIRLNAPSCITSWLLPRLMDFQQQYPDIDVELTSTIKHALEPNFDSFDMVIVYGKENANHRLHSQCLFEETLAPICRPDKIPAIELNQQPVEALKDYTWLHANPQQSDWKLWLEQTGHRGLSSHNNQHFATLDQAMNAALQGFGIAIGDTTLAQQDLVIGRLAQLNQTTVKSGNGYYLLHPKTRQSEAKRCLEEWLIAKR